MVSHITSTCFLIVTPLLSLVLYPLEALGFGEDHDTKSVVFCIMFCGPLFVFSDFSFQNVWINLAQLLRFSNDIFFKVSLI